MSIEILTSQEMQRGLWFECKSKFNSSTLVAPVQFQHTSTLNLQQLQAQRCEQGEFICDKTHIFSKEQSLGVDSKVKV